MAVEAEPTLEPIADFLKEVQVASLYNEQDILVLHEEMSLERALQALADKHVLSAPVLTGHPGSANDVRFVADRDVVGFLDVRDILLAFLDHLDVSRVLTLPLKERLKEVEAGGTTFSAKRVKELSPLGDDGNFIHSGRSKLSLWEVCYSYLLHPKRRIARASGRTSALHHRIALFNKDCIITQIISQTDIAKILLDNKSRIQQHLQHRAVDIPGLCSRTVVTMGADKSALEAVQIMKKYDVSAVAVVDPDGKLLGSFTTSAMRSMMLEHFGALALPVAEFLSPAPSLDSLPHSGAGSTPSFTSETCYTDVGLKSSSGGIEATGTSRASDGCEYGAAYAEELQQQLKEVESTSAVQYVHECEARKHPASHEWQQLAKVTEDGVIQDILELVISQRSHRAYIVDAAGKPLGIVTLSDMLYAFAGEKPSGRPRL